MERREISSYWYLYNSPRVIFKKVLQSLFVFCWHLFLSHVFRFVLVRCKISIISRIFVSLQKLLQAPGV